MKAISLWQPWASLWCSHRKIHETRHWPTRHRGWLLVHAAKRFVKDIEPGDPLREILDDEFGGHWAIDLPTGAIIGMVHMIACERTEDVYFSGSKYEGHDDFHCGDHSEGRYDWRRDLFRRFEHPIPYRGAQGIFNVPDDIVPKPTDALTVTKYRNGAPMFAHDGTMLDENGNRSIFDDVDE